MIDARHSSRIAAEQEVVGIDDGRLKLVECSYFILLVLLFLSMRIHLLTIKQVLE